MSQHMYSIRENEVRPKCKRRSLRELAWLLQISLTTISHERKWGRVGPLYGKGLEQYYSCSADVAQADYYYKATAKERDLMLGKDYAFAEHVGQQILKHRQSPDAIIMRLRGTGIPSRQTSAPIVCTATLPSGSYRALPFVICPELAGSPSEDTGPCAELITTMARV